MLFSAELPVWFFCVQEYGFLGTSENFWKITENPRTRRNTGTEDGPKGDQRGPKRPAGAATPLVAPGGGLWWSPPRVPTRTPIFTRREETPEQKLLFQST